MAYVRDLPNASSSAADEALEEWMGYYGTHFAFGVTMGLALDDNEQLV